MRKRYLTFFVIGALLVSSCASTGPSISKAEREKAEDEFHRKFLAASEVWYPRIHRVGYQLLTHSVPEHGSDTQKFNFVGVGVAELEKHVRKAYAIDKSIKGVMVTAPYPGSKAEGLDLKLGDIIEQVDGKKTDSVGDFYKRVRKTKKSVLKAKVLRKGKRFEIELPVEKIYHNAQFFLAPTPNLDASAAFSKINVGIGAIRYCRNDDELASIMGHELAHVTLKHSLKKLGTGIGTTVAYSVVAGVISAYTLPGVGGMAVRPVQDATDAAISRRYEREGDYFGMQHAFHSGYDIQNGSKVFARLATDSPSFSVLSEWFASHPMTSERFLKIEKIVEEFKSAYPKKFPMNASPDWDIVIPVQPGESMEEAIERLIQSKNITPSRVSLNQTVAKKAEELKALEDEILKKRGELAKLEEGVTIDVTTNGIGTASLANQGKGQASAYLAPKKS